MECRVWNVKCDASESFKSSISCETSSNFEISTTSNSQSCVASPIDTAKPDTFRIVQEDLPKRRSCSFPHRYCEAFRQIAAHVRKCHACHAICTLSPLRTAVPMRFPTNRIHDKSEVLRLPRKMELDTSKVLRLPGKMQRIF